MSSGFKKWDVPVTIKLAEHSQGGSNVGQRAGRQRAAGAGRDQHAFNVYFMGANDGQPSRAPVHASAPSAPPQPPQISISRRQIEDLRHSIEMQSPQLAQAPSHGRATTALPRYTSDLLTARVQQLPEGKRARLLHILSELEHTNELNASPDDVPEWLADLEMDDETITVSPQGHRDGTTTPPQRQEPGEGMHIPRSEEPQMCEASPLRSGKRDIGGGGGAATDPFTASMASLKEFSRSHAGRISTIVASGADFTSTISDLNPNDLISPTSAATDGGVPNMMSPQSEPDEQEIVFEVPVLPQGRNLVINALTTHGDLHYIGLCGIELFDADGELVNVTNPLDQVVAEPDCVTPEDPRCAANVVDGVNCTTDELHMWLAPYTKGNCHVISVVLDRVVTLSAMRIWNYNHSRAHASRGVDYAEILLDGEAIFKGSISPAPGNVVDAPACAEVVCFTDNVGILERVQATMEATTLDTDEVQRPHDEDAAGHRPPTHHRVAPSSPLAMGGMSPPSRVSAMECPTVSAVTIEILAGWGDTEYIGLSSLELIGADGKPLPLASITLNPPQADGDPSCLAHPDAEESWVASWQPGMKLCFRTVEPSQLASIRVRNYNAGGVEYTCVGVRKVRVWLDAMCVSPDEGTYVRKAPGWDDAEWAQNFSTSDVTSSLASSSISSSMQLRAKVAIRKTRLQGVAIPEWILDGMQYETPVLPVLYVLRLVFTRSDSNCPPPAVRSFQVLDEDGQPLQLAPEHLRCRPLAPLGTLMGLLPPPDGSSVPSSTSWCPGDNTLEILVILEEPRAIGVVRVTAPVSCSFSVYGDDDPLYQGHIVGGIPGHTSIVFTPQEDVASKEAGSLPFQRMEERAASPL